MICWMSRGCDAQTSRNPCSGFAAYCVAMTLFWFNGLMPEDVRPASLG